MLFGTTIDRVQNDLRVAAPANYYNPELCLLVHSWGVHQIVEIAHRTSLLATLIISPYLHLCLITVNYLMSNVLGWVFLLRKDHSHRRAKRHQIECHHQNE